MDYKGLGFERACAAIDLGALKGNVGIIKRRLQPGTRLMAVVKGNAYGHGIVSSARAVLSEGADMLGVATTSEGAELRLAGINAPILVFCAAHAYNYADLINFKLTGTVYTYVGAERLSKVASALGKRAEVHIKVDTGMNRVGFSPDDKSVMLKLWNLPALDVTGFYSHFADAMNDDVSYTEKQYETFLDTVEFLEAHGHRGLVKHISNSGSVICHRGFDQDMVRVGTVMYGLLTPEELRYEDWGFRPVLSLGVRILQVKELPAGETVGYNRTYRVESRIKMATAAIGYADGYSRALSNKGAAIVNGAWAKVIGNVCMDQIMLDVSEVPGVSVGDVAMLIGSSGELNITAADVASVTGTVSLDVVTSLSGRVYRHYFE